MADRKHHNTKRRVIFLALFMPVFLLTGVFQSALSADNKISVFVSVLPQHYFVQQIGKGLVDIEVMIPPGANPATYEPRPAQMTALKNACLYFSIGVPFEKVWLTKIAAINPDMRIIHTDAGIEKRYLERTACGGHDGAPVTERDEALPASIPDPHIWLSPPLVMLQARTILAALQQADPDRYDIYARNYRDFIIRLVEMDDRLRRLFTGIRTDRFMVFHPAWGYFADAYGLTQVAIEVEGKSPKPAQLEAVISHARHHGTRQILAQPQSSSRIAEQVARAVDGQVIYVDPLSLDWERNLFQIAETIKTILQ